MPPPSARSDDLSGAAPPWRPPQPSAPPRIVAVGYRRINKMLQELAPDVADRASVDVLDVGFEQAVARVKALQSQQPVDVVVAAGSNGGYLRQHLDVPVVLGSATPSLETLHNARSGRYAHLRLSRRAGEARAPAVRVVDVRKRPLEHGLSAALLEAVAACVARGEQALVFRNRRGYAPVLLCHDCGWTAHCPRCSTPEHGTAMTVHGGGRRLQCHHCGTRRPVPDACPDCGGLALQPRIGLGSVLMQPIARPVSSRLYV